MNEPIISPKRYQQAMRRFNALPSGARYGIRELANAFHITEAEVGKAVQSGELAPPKFHDIEEGALPELDCTDETAAGFRGGQGHTAQEVEDAATGALILIAMFLLWVLGTGLYGLIAWAVRLIGG